MKTLIVHGYEVKIMGDHTFKIKCKVPVDTSDDEKKLHRVMLKIAEYLESEGFFESENTDA
jgi:hypothetical protein